MSDFLSRLVAHSTPLPHAVQPRQRSVFEPDTGTEPDVPDEPRLGANTPPAVPRPRDVVTEPPRSAQFRGLLDQIDELRARADATSSARNPDAPATREGASGERSRIASPEPGAPAHRQPTSVTRPAERVDAARRAVTVHPAIEPVRTAETQATGEPGLQVVKSSAQAERERGFDIVARAILGESPPSVEREKQTIQPRTVTVQPSQAQARVFPAHEARSMGGRSDNAPVIHVSIGRIEVRAVRETERPATKAVAPPPKLTVEDYLLERRKGAR